MSDYKKTAFVIAHYHQEGHLTKNLFDHVRYIHRFAEKIIFVSTKLNKNSIQKLKPYANVIVRKNEGYDFYSYKLGLLSIQNINDIDHLIFFNSSFITINPKKLYERYSSSICENGLYGLTECSAPHYHIQSYFFSFAGKSLIQSKVFWDWWQQLIPISNREIVIQKYEVGMSQWFLKNKIFIKSAYKPNIYFSFILYYRYLRSINFNGLSILRRLRILLDSKKNYFSGHTKLPNPTHYLYDNLFSIFSIVKIDLLTKNPTKQNLKHFIRSLSKGRNKSDEIKFLI
jgi:rhamnosyltransferase